MGHGVCLNIPGNQITMTLNRSKLADSDVVIGCSDNLCVIRLQPIACHLARFDLGKVNSNSSPGL